MFGREDGWCRCRGPAWRAAPLPAELHSLQMIDYLPAQHLHQPEPRLLLCRLHSDVPFKYLDRRRLAYLLNSRLRATPVKGSRAQAAISFFSSFFFLFFFFSFISQHNKMDVSPRASQLLSVQDARKKFEESCNYSSPKRSRPTKHDRSNQTQLARVLLYVVRKTHKKEKSGVATLAINTGGNGH